MKNKIIEFICYTLSFYFVLFMIFCFIYGCHGLSLFFTDTLNIELSADLFYMLGFFSLGAFVSVIQYEIEKNKEKKQ